MSLFRSMYRPERHLAGECLLPQMRERESRRQARRSIRSWKTPDGGTSFRDGRRTRDYIPLDVISLRGTLTPPSPRTMGRLALCAIVAALLAIRVFC